MSYACLYMPDFLLQAALRDERGASERAVALVDGKPPCLRVIAATGKAREAGVMPGMTQAQAAQLAEIRRRSQAQEDSAHAALLDCAQSSSPRVEETAADTMAIDLAGLEKLLGPPSAIASQLLRRAEGLGLTAHVAIAANPDAAILAARGFHGMTLIAPGEEARRLGELPVAVLNAPPEMLSSLRRWGIYRLKDLAALPPLPLSERLGQEGIRWQRLARGEHSRSLIIAREALRFEEAFEFEDPVEILDSLDFILSRLLTQLSRRLAARSLAARELRLRMDLAEGMEPEPSLALEEQKRETRGERRGMVQDSTLVSPLSSLRYERTLRFPAPLCNARLFLSLWRLRLESDLPLAPVVKITITAEPAKPRVAQGGLFAPLAPDPEKLELTLARIASIVGSGNAGSPEILDTHRPDAFRMTEFNPSWRTMPERSVSTFPAARVAAPPKMAFRLFRPALPARVELRSGQPTRIFSSTACGKILLAAGPWRSSGGWWGDDGWNREEWDVEVECEKQTGLYLLYYDPARGEWYLQGEYD